MISVSVLVWVFVGVYWKNRVSVWLSVKFYIYCVDNFVVYVVLVVCEGEVL